MHPATNVTNNEIKLCLECILQPIDISKHCTQIEKVVKIASSIDKNKKIIEGAMFDRFVLTIIACQFCSIFCGILKVDFLFVRLARFLLLFWNFMTLWESILALPR